MANQKTYPIRYAVVGLGWIAQTAVLPAFKHAKKNSELVALVSGDPVKLKKLGKKYGVKQLFSYEQYDMLLASGLIDAVYIALPNNLHAEYAIRAAQKGIHILCEKPMAVTEEECREMIHAAQEKNVQLMIAYRLHFEKANLQAVEMVKSGKIGEPRVIESLFSMQVKPGNIRLKKEMGGGPLRDLGIYCINAARYLFQSEPLEVFGISGQKGSRFEEVEEMDSVLLKFADDRLATFVCSFGAYDTSNFAVLGTKGKLYLESSFEMTSPMTHYLTRGQKTQKKVFSKRDQFGPELLYFSDCIQKGIKPEPSGEEGLADVRVIQAIYRSIQSGKLEKVVPVSIQKRPTLKQEIYAPPAKKMRLVRVQEPAS